MGAWVEFWTLNTTRSHEEEGDKDEHDETMMMMMMNNDEDRTGSGCLLNLVSSTDILG